MTAKTRRLLLAFAVLGLGASSWSSYVHYSLLTVPGYTSFCDVSGAVSCTQAYLSQYGSLWGVPVALGGVIYFATVLLIVGVAGQPSAKGRENVPAYVFALSTAALAFVLYLGWASFFKLNTVCLLCATTYVAVIALFIISAGATTFPMTSLPRRASTDMARLVRSPLGLASVAGLALGTLALLNAFPREAHAAAAASASSSHGGVHDAGGAGARPHRPAEGGLPEVVRGPAPGDRSRGARRRQGAGGEVQRLSVPAVPRSPSSNTSRSSRSTGPPGSSSSCSSTFRSSASATRPSRAISTSRPARRRPPWSWRSRREPPISSRNGSSPTSRRSARTG